MTRSTRPTAMTTSRRSTRNGLRLTPGVGWSDTMAVTVRQARCRMKEADALFSVERSCRKTGVIHPIGANQRTVVPPPGRDRGSSHSLPRSELGEIQGTLRPELLDLGDV